MALAAKESPDTTFDKAAQALEHAFFNNMVIALGGYFVHRGRAIELKDGNPMNEVRVIGSSLVTNGGLMGTDNTIKMKPSNTVLKIGIGERTALFEKGLQKLSRAFFTDMEAKFT